MSLDKLNVLYEQLRSELDALDQADEESRKKLQRIATEIEVRLASTSSEQAEDSLADSIPDAIMRMEVSHPRAAGILNQIMVTLANMGI